MNLRSAWKKHQIEAAGIVLGLDLIGGSRVPARGSLVLEDTHFQRGDGARHGLRDRRLCAPVDDAVGQVPQEIKHTRLDDPGRQREALLQQHDQARTDAGQRLQRSKECVELVWPHEAVLHIQEATAAAPMGRPGLSPQAFTPGPNA